MTFQKGHTLSRGKHKPGAGNKKKPARLIKDLLDRAMIEDLPGLLQTLIDKGKTGHIESAIYMVDRLLGKPKQQTEILGGESIGAGTLLNLFTALQERRRQYLKEGDNGQKRISEGMVTQEEDCRQSVDK